MLASPRHLAVPVQRTSEPDDGSSQTDREQALGLARQWTRIGALFNTQPALGPVDLELLIVRTASIARTDERLFVMAEHHQLVDVERLCRWLIGVTDGTTGAMVLDIRGGGKKLGRLLMLAPVQQALMAFNLEIGYLAEAEAAYRLPSDDSKRLPDYPLFPGGKLIYDRTDLTRRRKRARSTANMPSRWTQVAEKTLRDWHDDVETVLGIAHVQARGNNGWRRAFTNLYDQWHAEPRVKDLITGHTTREKETHGSTRTGVYLDPSDTRLLREGKRLIEHARTVYAFTGEAPPAAERHFPTMRRAATV